MFGMEIDEPLQPAVLPPRQRILQRLALIGVPEEYLDQEEHGLVSYLKNNQFQVEEIVSVIFPSDEEAVQAVSEDEDETPKGGPTPEELFKESMCWLQWLMFGANPRNALQLLSEMSAGQRGVCGAVWGNNDIAYRCRTCEHDPTCAICVPCFQNGNHKNHDYSIIYTGGGCCDCGDITAWKREGFCSKHKGAEQVKPLSNEFACTIRPILDLLLGRWKDKMIFLEDINVESPRLDGHLPGVRKVADVLASEVVDMLLNFCQHSESLLSFVSGRVISSAGLLDVIVRAETFLSGSVVKKLHELLLKLLGDPQFKYEFAKVFLSYYPTVINVAVKEANDQIFKKYPLLSTFSVQIFTVPTLTPRLVKEIDLLAMLLECLDRIFASCAGEDGRLQVNKWGNLYEATLRVVEDIRFVMSHAVVPRYVAQDRQDIIRTWMRLLGFVQGMNPQKRETGIHVEEENENIHLPFVLGHSIANIHSLLVGGAFSVSSNEEMEDENSRGICQHEFDDQDCLRHAKVGRTLQESSVRSVSGRSFSDHSCKFADGKADLGPIPSSLLLLMYECLRAVENWLGVDNTSGSLPPKSSDNSGYSFFAFKRTLSRFRSGRYILRSFNSSTSDSKLGSSRQCSSPSRSAFRISSNLEAGQVFAEDTAHGGAEDHVVDIGCVSELEAPRILSSSDWPDIEYDVSSQDISVHIPLHRLLSMLLQRILRKCYSEHAVTNTSDATTDDPLSDIYHDFFGHILGGCHPLGFSAYVMEHALRIRVFCAEVHAGMWRKNGDAAILSCEWYRSVRWSEQGLELDLFLLQCCAALAPADLCVERILARFGLSSYLSLNVERPSEYEPILLQEMLTLIIQLVKERRFCGLTTTECLQRELVYKLFLGDATRSQLVKSLTRDLSKVDKLQEILDTVAVYSNPSGMNQGMYKLRLDFWKELDLYHPRWNSRDLQIAEERYMRFCNTSALTAQLPKWSKIYYPLRRVACIATCKTTLQIVRAVAFYAVFSDKPTTSRAPDSVLLTGLHLLSLALDICLTHRVSGENVCYDGDEIPILKLACEEIYTPKHGDHSLLSLLVLLMRIHEKEKGHNFIEVANFNLSLLIENLLKRLAELDSGCMLKLLELAPELVNQLSQSMSNPEADSSRLLLDSDMRKAKARERQAAIMEKMRAQQSKFLESMDATKEEGANDADLGKKVLDSDLRDDSKDSERVICSLCHDHNSKSPVSYLVLLQKSRLASFVDRTPPSWEDANYSRKEYMPAGRSLTSISSTKHGDLRASLYFSQSELKQMFQRAIKDFASDGHPEEVEAFLDFLGTHFPSLRNLPMQELSCDEVENMPSFIEMVEEHMYSLIQERMGNQNRSIPVDVQIINSHTESILLGKYLASVSKETVDPSVSEKSRSHSKMPLSDKNTSLPTYDGFGPSNCDGIYLSSCGHAVHQGCLDRYLSSLKERYFRRIVFEGGHIVDPDQGEFLCPVCRGLANSTLPALPQEFKARPRLLLPIVASSDSADHLTSSTQKVDWLRVPEALSLLQSAADVVRNDEFLKSIPLQRLERHGMNLDSIFRVVRTLYLPGEDKISDAGRISYSLIMWDMLKYSLISTEISARSRKDSLTPNYSLDALYKELKSSSGFILSLLLNIVQRTRTKNSLSIFLRLKGIQLLADSICFSVPFDNGNQVEGNVKFLLESLEPDVQHPDVQFWKRVSDPVLARDAFSSLMWTLFCLPVSFLCSEDTFLCLVHVFYVVTVTQVVATYYGKKQGDNGDIFYKDSLITDIYKVMKEDQDVSYYFRSNYVDSFADIKDAIRSLSFPYLRRCALLWRLINSSSAVPFSYGNHLTGDGYDMMGCTNYALEENVEIENLEKMFKIPALDIIFNDEVSRPMSLRWLCHFSKVFKAHNRLSVLHSTPAVPLRLMVLPNIYQDLLQSYIKKPCPDCGTVQEEPIVCLLCGKLCSPNWKTCCRESGCQTHAMDCGAGIGVFLLIRKTSILLQRCARQAPWPSPYLDAFGEEDNEIHRGKPLYLNEERYATLTRMVASHGLDRSSKVLRQTTIGSFFML